MRKRHTLQRAVQSEDRGGAHLVAPAGVVDEAGADGRLAGQGGLRHQGGNQVAVVDVAHYLHNIADWGCARRDSGTNCGKAKAPRLFPN